MCQKELSNSYKRLREGARCIRKELADGKAAVSRERLKDDWIAAQYNAVIWPSNKAVLIGAELVCIGYDQESIIIPLV